MKNEIEINQYAYGRKIAFMEHWSLVFGSIVHFFDTIWDQGFENYFDKIHNKQLDEFDSYCKYQN